MFCQQAKPRGGVAKILSDGEELFVTTKELEYNAQIVVDSVLGWRNWYTHLP
jgi:hypothetical protein